MFEKKFNLKEAVIASTNGSTKATYRQVIKNTGDFLLKKLNKSDVLGISWGKTLNDVANSLPSQNKDIEIIQILGDIGANLSANSITLKLSEKFNCNYTLLSAPAIVDSREIKKAILSDSNIKNVLSQFNNISLAIVGIGDLSKKSSFYQSDYLNYEYLKKLKDLGATGDICGKFLKIDGSIVKSELNERIIGIEFEQLQKIPYVISVAVGKRKSKAILSALNSGVINILITDENTAERILEINRERDN